MKFFDIDKIQQNSGISNKYLLTTVVASRARALSEDKGTRVLEETSKGEKVISLALSELERNDLTVCVGKQVSSEGPISSPERDEPNDESESDS